MNLLIAFTSSLMVFGYLMVSIVDIRTKRIPNTYVTLIATATLIEMIFRVIKESSTAPFLRGLISCFFVFAALLCLNLIKPSNLGIGDVKFGAVLALGIGQWGISAAFASIAISFILGGIFALTLILLGRSKKSELPFGPFLVAGTLIMYFFIIKSDQYF